MQTNVPDSLEAALMSAEAHKYSDVEKTEIFYNFLFAKARQRGVPLAGLFELTPLCNLSCKMCYVHLTNEQIGNKSLLSVAQWKNLISQAYQEGLMRATFTGGECLTYPGFDDVYLYAQSLGITATVLTNGLLLDKKRIQFFLDNPVNCIQVSLYGSNDDEYEQVCGRRCFSTVLENIKNAKKAGLPIQIAITPNRFIADGGVSLIKFVSTLGIPYSINLCLYTPRVETGRSEDVIDLDLDGYLKLYRVRAECNGKNLLQPNPCELPEPSQDSSKRIYGLKCMAGMCSFSILWDGRMTPCSSLREIVENPLDEGFSSAWRSIHNAVLKVLIPAECESCRYKRFCPTCVVLHGRDAPPGHASPSICQRAIRLAKEGFIHLT